MSAHFHSPPVWNASAVVRPFPTLAAIKPISGIVAEVGASSSLTAAWSLAPDGRLERRWRADNAAASH